MYNKNSIYKTQLLRVAAIEEKSDKNNIPFKRITVATADKKRVQDMFTLEVSTVASKVKKTSFNAFKHNYIELSQLAKDKQIEIAKIVAEDLEGIEADFGYALEVGDKVEGSIVTRKVSPYDIPNADGEVLRTVDHYTCAVLGDTNDKHSFDQTILQTFKGNNHPLQNELLGLDPLNNVDDSEEDDSVAEMILEDSEVANAATTTKEKAPATK